MEWFFIEALFALAVGIAIVWWTMAPQRRRPRMVDPKADQNADPGAHPKRDSEVGAKSAGISADAASGDADTAPGAKN